MFCNLISIDYSTYQCVKCNSIISVSDGTIPIIPCVAIDQTILPKNLANSEEIERRYNICLKCEFFKEDTCTQCGCIINRYKNFTNKLSDKDAICPKDRW